MAKNIYEVKTDESNLNVRAAAESNANIIGKLAKGALVEVLSAANGWAKVKVDGKDGYVSSAYLSAASNAYEVTTNSSNLNIRAAASTDAEIVGKAAKGAILKVVGTSGDWAEVEFEGKNAFASLQYLTKVTDSDINLTEATGQGSMFGSSDLFA